MPSARISDLGGAPRPRFVEFVLLIALVMALGSMSIDNLLPAFEPIRQAFGVPDANEMQLILTSYMAGFAIMQIVWGPLSDVVGRRPVLMAGLALYTVGTLLAILAKSYEILLVARIVQGLGGAATRVLAVTIVRDRFSGREMARVMSLTIMVFIIVPVFAPALGSLFLLLGGWRLIFVSMLALVLIIAAWFGLRMPETLHPEYRMPLSFRAVGRGIAKTISNRMAVGYATAMALSMASLMSYLNSTQQIFETTIYGLGHLFVLVFGGVAICMGCASFANSRLVRRYGMRRLSHAGLLGFIAVTGTLAVIAVATGGRPPLVVLLPMLGAAHFLLSLTMPNFNAMAMEPLGDVAGTASSFIGAYTTLMGALGGLVVGQAFNGTIIPLAAGYVSFGLLALVVVLWTEEGRLFAPRHPDPMGAPAPAE
jgi:DHA1 family bicyclomycin/chloramphenicol resistance-like MFS transporter